MDAHISDVDLSDADLTRAYLGLTTLRTTRLDRANFTDAHFGLTTLVTVDLHDAIGLETCRHYFGSKIDYLTLRNSCDSLPVQFLRGIGLSDRFIEYMPSLFDHAIQYCTVFISYSTKDQEFAENLYNNLKDEGGPVLVRTP
jgi:hypothetical protein